MSNCITTYSNVNFDPLNPEKDQILINDIAHSLSLMTRANGHFKEFYSVAQHSIFCCEEALQRGYSNKVALACLLHDGSEAYLADITRPVKKSLVEYLEIEDILQNTIYEKFLKEELTKDEKEQINSIDNTLLYYEFIHYMDKKLEVKADELISSPNFKFEDFSSVEDKFKELFSKLYQ